MGIVEESSLEDVGMSLTCFNIEDERELLINLPLGMHCMVHFLSTKCILNGDKNMIRHFRGEPKQSRRKRAKTRHKIQ